MITSEDEIPDFAITLLQTLPGITSHNIGTITSNVKNLHELSQMSYDKLVELLGKTAGKALYDFFNDEPALGNEPSK